MCVCVRLYATLEAFPVTFFCVCAFLCVFQVIVLDPTQENAAELLNVAEMFYTNNIPLRYVCACLCLCAHAVRVHVCFFENVLVLWLGW